MTFGAARRASRRIGIVMGLKPTTVSALRPSVAPRPLLLLEESSLIKATHLSNMAVSLVTASLVALAAKTGAGYVPLASRRRHVFGGLVRETKIAATLSVAPSRLFSFGPLVRQEPS